MILLLLNNLGMGGSEAAAVPTGLWTVQTDDATAWTVQTDDSSTWTVQ